MTYIPSTPNPATAAPAASGTLSVGTTIGISTGTADQRATPAQIAALLGGVTLSQLTSVIMQTPTSLPALSGVLWRNGGNLAIS